MTNMIRVVVAEVGRAPVVREIENSLEAMQGLVGGFVECVRAGDLDLWVNEEGVLLGLPFNRMVAGVPLAGLIFVAASNDEGELVGLTDKQVRKAVTLLSAPVSEVIA